MNKDIVEVKLKTKYNLVSKNLLLNKNTIPTVNIRDCINLKGGNWTLVPGNSKYGLDDFFVMTFEAKWDGTGSIYDGAKGYCGNGDNYNNTGCNTSGSVGIISKPEDPPLTDVNYFEAKQFCSNLGPKYHLITNVERMTILRNVENVSSNWVDGTIGSDIDSGGGFKRGNIGLNDNTAYSYPTSLCYGPTSGRNNKSLLVLSNGEGIWDFIDNAEEMVSELIVCTNGFSCNDSIKPSKTNGEFKDISQFGLFGGHINISPSNLSWNMDLNNYGYGMGKFYSAYSDKSEPIDLPQSLSQYKRTYVIKYGPYGNGVSNRYINGLYTLIIKDGPTKTTHFIKSQDETGMGFRCAYTIY